MRRNYHDEVMIWNSSDSGHEVSAEGRRSPDDRISRRPKGGGITFPIYYYEMSGQLKTLLDRLNPLFPGDYAFRDVYFLSAAAEDEDYVPQRAVAGLEGWIACFEKARLAGTVFMGGVTAAGEMPDHPALSEAKEFGKNI